MNLVVLMGNLTRDPELSETSTGKTVCKFSIAVSRDFEEGTDFFNCTAWGSQAENISKYFTKGKRILIKGRIKISDSEKDGNKRRFTDIIVDKFDFCGGKDQASEVGQVSEEVGVPEGDYSSVPPVSGTPLPTVAPDKDIGLPF